MRHLWIWIIVGAVVIGGIIGLLATKKGENASENAASGAMAGGCMAAGCLVRIFIAGASIALIIWLFSKLFR